MDNNNSYGTGNVNTNQGTYSNGQQGGYQMQENKKASGLAIASMVCGIVSIVLCCIWYISIILAIVAVVLGVINNVKGLGGKGMAIAGIVTGAIGIILAVALIALVAFGVATTDLSTYYNF